MKNTVDFLEDIKAKYDIKSNYGLAKLMNQTDTAVARWMHGKNSFSDETSMQVADLLDIDPAFVVACIHAERAKQAPERAMWERIARIALASAAALAITSTSASAGGLTVPEASNLYIMSNQVSRMLQRF